MIIAIVKCTLALLSILVQYLFPVIAVIFMGSCLSKLILCDSETSDKMEKTEHPNKLTDNQSNYLEENPNNDTNIPEDVIEKSSKLSENVLEEASKTPDTKALTFEGIYGDVFVHRDENLSGNVLKIPSVVDIENNLLTTQAELPSKMSNTIYKINDSYFTETERMSDDGDTLMRYELYKVDKAEGLWSDDEDMIDLPLEITIQLVPNGLIINSNVYLTDAQWHTISSIDELYCCQVCQVYCNKVQIEEHVKIYLHKVNLDKYPPLRQYDLSIVRKIKSELHCGVCNESFPDKAFRDHESTKSHEGNLLAAINRVSDLMFDSDLNTNNYDNYDVNTERNILTERFLNAENNRQASERNNQVAAHNNQNLQQNNQNIWQNNQNLQQNNQNLRHNNQNHLRNNHSARSSESSDRIDSKQFPELRKNNNNMYLNANISVYDDYSDNEDVEEYVTPREGVSYASMARKPRIELPKYLKIDLGTKEVRVKFESWHMLITPEKNMFYCMVCEGSDLIRNKLKHVTSSDHKQKLASCSVVAAYDNYLVRTVKDKLYHCGHCNNLQYNHQMDDHIESVHPKKTKIIDTTTKNNNNNIVFELKTGPKKLDVVPVVDKNIFGEITISPFNSDVKITVLSYNVIMQKDGQYYCAVCDKICVNVKAHVEELRHIEIINMTPFLRIYKSHLTRSVRGTLHCALCNELVHTNNIFMHNIEPRHTTALATALGMKKTQKPGNIKHFSSGNTKNVTNKPGNTQPSFNSNLAVNNNFDKNDKTNNAAGKSGNVNANLSTNIISENEQKCVETEKSTEDDFTLALKNALKIAMNQNTSGTTEKIPLTPGNRAELALTQKLPETSLKTDNMPENATAPTLAQNRLRNNQFQTQNFAQVQSHNLFQSGQKSLNSVQNTQSLNMAQNPIQAGQKSVMGKNPIALPASQSLLQPGQNSVANAQNALAGASAFAPVLPLRRPHHLPQSRQNSPQRGQNSLLGPPPFWSTAQNLPQSGQNSPQPGQNSLLGNPLIMATSQSLPQSGQNSPQHGQNYLAGKTPLLPLPNHNLFIPGQQSFNNPNLSNLQQKPINFNQYPTINSFIPTPFANHNKENIQNNAKTNKNPVLNIGDVQKDIKEQKETENVKSSERSTPVKKSKKALVIENKFSVNVTSESDEDAEVFDEEQFVLLTLKTSYFKVTNISFNSLVYVDNGIRHCFVCSSMVKLDKYQQHIDSRDHMKNIKKTKFLDKYSGQLFRQMYLMYHCTVCNVLMTSKEIKVHLDWPLHNECYQISYNIINKKNRKELKSGLKVYAVETQKEAIFHSVNEPEIKLLNAYQIVLDLKTKESKTTPKTIKSASKESRKRNKLIIYKNSVIKIPYDNWHGIVTSKNGTKCVLCQVNLRVEHVLAHVATDYHTGVLGKAFEERYYPAFMRKINESRMNCIICNAELPNNEKLTFTHMKGRKHTRSYEDIIKNSASPDSYTDCYEDVLNI